MIELSRLRAPFDVPDIGRFADGTDALGAEGIVHPEDEIRIAIPGSRRVIVPKSDGQRSVRAEDHQQRHRYFSIGPAGTGKTYLAVACGLDALYKKRVRRIILVRPAVEAGENLGFLPGDLQEKVDPYLRPLYDALEDMMPPDRMRRALEELTIEIAPLAYMRGRTLSDAFVILDEAQNATTAQMKMFLTRLGLNSQVVITGDKTQIDLPRKTDSGLLEVERILEGHRWDLDRVPRRQGRHPAPAREGDHQRLRAGVAGGGRTVVSRQNDRNGSDSVLRRLSGEPGVSWSERISHHGARILLVVVLAGLVVSFFPTGPRAGCPALRVLERRSQRT